LGHKTTLNKRIYEKYEAQELEMKMIWKTVLAKRNLQRRVRARRTLSK
jgi:hypothetical protein